MIEDVKPLVESYCRWLKEETVLREIDGQVEITTPFVDRHNDLIQIFVRRGIDGGFVLTDAGYTIDDLEMSGLSLRKEELMNHLRTALSGFGVNEERGELLVQVPVEEFPIAKNNLIQSILAVNDLYYLATPKVAPKMDASKMFRSEVAGWLDGIGIEYDFQTELLGNSGLSHTFDFHIRGSDPNPDKIVGTLNRPGVKDAKYFLFACLDVLNGASGKIEPYAILNFEGGKYADSISKSFRNYKINSFHWNQRGEYERDLAA